MSKIVSSLIARAAAIEATRARFFDQPFQWGQADCATMAHFHVSQFGYALPILPPYRSYAGAVRVLKTTLGFKTLHAFLDATLEPIAPAAMLPGDLALLAGKAPFGALTICVGRKVIGWHEDSDVPVNIIPYEFEGAWRV